MAKMFYSIVAVLGVLSIAGCGIKAQNYVQIRDRADIQATGGNAGVLMGTANYQEPEKKTRKVYVLELTKPVPESEVKKIEQEVSTKVTQESQASESHSSRGIDPLPQDIVQRQETSLSVADEDNSAKTTVTEEQAGPTSPVNYVVQKDDTLQKISKKFYNSYSKWTKIYEANKDKIKDPNFLKSGVEIVIPPLN